MPLHTDGEGQQDLSLHEIFREKMIKVCLRICPAFPDDLTMVHTDVEARSSSAQVSHC